MKQRTTFIVSEHRGTHPDNFVLTDDSFAIKSLPPSTVREDRLTFGFHELPPEIWEFLKECHEVHLRWTRGSSYTLLDPYSSRTPAGLHVFLSPLKGNKQYDYSARAVGDKLLTRLLGLPSARLSQRHMAYRWKSAKRWKARLWKFRESASITLPYDQSLRLFGSSKRSLLVRTVKSSSSRWRAPTTLI
jgi:hypothetical protein